MGDSPAFLLFTLWSFTRLTIVTRDANRTQKQRERWELLAMCFYELQNPLHVHCRLKRGF